MNTVTRAWSTIILMPAPTMYSRIFLKFPVNTLGPVSGTVKTLAATIVSA